MFLIADNIAAQGLPLRQQPGAFARLARVLAHDPNGCPKCRLLQAVYDPAVDAERFARCHDELTDATTDALTALERRWRAARRQARAPEAVPLAAPGGARAAPRP